MHMCILIIAEMCIASGEGVSLTFPTAKNLPSEDPMDMQGGGERHTKGLHTASDSETIYAASIPALLAISLRILAGKLLHLPGY